MTDEPKYKPSPPRNTLWQGGAAEGGGRGRVRQSEEGGLYRVRVRRKAVDGWVLCRGWVGEGG
ncbi:hypothetical protein E2C01_067398 [Portunus trituberculatus]|uniref:Uncharacterized protein n=1 Tax=Portunus trituberculatus TaxID=210409 RepID=A0A5B7HKW0_PORTR|nr:hypothetical protein [Portunus trituberculatus]